MTSGCHQQEFVWIIAETDSGALSINGRRSYVQQVKPGLRYRLRVAFVSPFETLPEGCQHWLEVDQHRLTVIALDGNLLEPVPVERVALFDGDRIDLILETSLGKDANGAGQEYEIRLVSVASYNGSCEQEHLRFASSSSRFKLKYVGTEAAGTQILMKEPDDGDGARGEFGESRLFCLCFDPPLRGFCAWFGTRDRVNCDIRVHDWCDILRKMLVSVVVL